MSVQPIRQGETELIESRGIVARQVAGALSTVDQWDVCLILGVVLGVAGVWLQWGMAVAFIVAGALLTLGGLWGARSALPAPVPD